VSKRAWIIFAGICVLILGSLIYVSSQGRVDVSKVDANAVQPAALTSGNIADHTFGKPDGKVMLIEYGDFQCPGCGSAHPTIKELTEKYKDQLSFVFRNFPITNIHPNARAAAAAVEAAGLQGKYWEMHDKVYENQSSWSNLSASERTPFFINYASELGLSSDTFKTDMTSDAVSKKINFDQALGKKAGADATPTFFLNGKKLGNEWSDKEQFEKLLVETMKAQGITLPE
jgi:protein-disulfide isomerase